MFNNNVMRVVWRRVLVGVGFMALGAAVPAQTGSEAAVVPEASSADAGASAAQRLVLRWRDDRVRAERQAVWAHDAVVVVGTASGVSADESGGSEALAAGGAVVLASASLLVRRVLRTP